ncbi:hypothetical protein PVL30_000576 [Lodderomyces elongisporus]|uniref:uncharacterized protein n=1 Tax=Lodderomyces elongisporus TaxID=36914 RepID=UPI00291CBF49|nr:uncharacterized protein PVL30_000576 [Lodderomyces elongisporus]WLF76871.1 hypothetical protein PVL30_000576 [Lodderomyces elongisporus]
MNPTLIRTLAASSKTVAKTAATASKPSYTVVPQYKYYLRRIPSLGVWASGIAFFFGWPHLYVWYSNFIFNAPGNRGQFY